jgi:hypothetical protein
MSTSGSVSFSMDRNDLCIAALRTSGMLGLEQAVCPAALLSWSSLKLNQLVKHWENSGYHLWNRAHATVFLNPSQDKYSLGTSGDRATDTFVQTTITATALATATTITATSVTGMSVNDNIGVCLDANTTQWTTISAINTSTLVITLAVALTSQATLGATVFTYTTQMLRPLAIETATIRNVALIDRMLGYPKSREEYFNYPLKYTAGTVVSYYYNPNPQHSTGDTGTLHVYQPPTLCNETIQIEYVRSIQDFDAATDSPDLPQRWLLALEYNLAVLMCSAVGKETKKASLMTEATKYLQDATASDYETADVFFIPGSN